MARVFEMHPLLELEEPVIYVSERLFTPGSCPTGSSSANSRAAASANSAAIYLEYKDKRFEIVEIGPVNALDILYCKRQKAEFEEEKHKFMQEIRSTELYSREDVIRELCDNSVMELILGKVLPKLTGEQLSSNLQRLAEADANNRQTDNDIPPSRQTMPTGSRQQGQRQNAQGEIAREVIRELRLTNAMTECNAKTLAELFQTEYSTIEEVAESFRFENGFVKMDGQIYLLVELKDYILAHLPSDNSRIRRAIRQIDSSQSRTEFVNSLMEFYGGGSVVGGLEKTIDSILKAVNGALLRYENKNFIQEYACTSEQLQQAIKERYSGLLKVEAAYQYEEQLHGIETRRELESKYRSIMRQAEYEENGAGFKRTASGYYIFQDTGEYEVTFNRLTYKFPNARVAVHLSGSGRGIQVNAPIVINNYKHPFLSNHAPEQRICLGQFNVSRFNSLATDEKVVATLSKGVEVLKFGYRRSPSPYHRIDSNMFDNYLVRR